MIDPKEPSTEEPSDDEIADVIVMLLRLLPDDARQQVMFEHPQMAVLSLLKVAAEEIERLRKTPPPGWWRFYVSHSIEPTSGDFKLRCAARSSGTDPRELYVDTVKPQKELILLNKQLAEEMIYRSIVDGLSQLGAAIAEGMPRGGISLEIKR